MPDDDPIAWTEEGRPLYDNASSVVAVAAPITIGGVSGVLGIRRGKGAGAGLLGIPGGFHMSGDRWQDAGAAEVIQETGYLIDPGQLRLGGLVTDEYGHNVVLARSDAAPVLTGQEPDGEASEILALGPEHFRRDLWAFPSHLALAIMSHDRFYGDDPEASWVMIETLEEADAIIADHEARRSPPCEP